jgi:hypothetical protein
MVRTTPVAIDTTRSAGGENACTNATALSLGAQIAWVLVSRPVSALPAIRRQFPVAMSIVWMFQPPNDSRRPSRDT